MTAAKAIPLKRKVVTREDVARRARVSVATVSMSLRGDPRIKEETARLVKMVARELNYRPKASASALAGGRTHSIGFVFAHPRFEERVLLRAYSPLIERVGEILSERNYHLNLVVQSLIRDEQGEHKLPRLFRESGTEGFLVVHKPYPMLAEALESQGVPCVFLDSEPVGSHIAVYADECRAAEMMIEHLIGLGHRRIANLTTLREVDRASASHRMVQFPRGYLRAMAGAGLPAMPGWDEPINPLDLHLRKLWSQPAPPTAIVTYDDQTASLVMKWLFQRGLEVPTDVSVAALHDTGFAELESLAGPPLTCVDNMQKEMATVAVEKLLALVEESEDAESTCLQPKLIVRQSTGVVAGAAS